MKYGEKATAGQRRAPMSAFYISVIPEAEDLSAIVKKEVITVSVNDSTYSHREVTRKKIVLLFMFVLSHY